MARQQISPFPVGSLVSLSDADIKASCAEPTGRLDRAGLELAGSTLQYEVVF